MKKYTPYILSALACYLFIYVSIAFVLVEPVPFEWPEGARFALVLFGCCASFIASAILLQENDRKLD